MKKVSEKHLQYALYALIAVGVLGIGYLVFASGFQVNLGATPTPTIEPVEKAKIVLTIITVPGCRYCTDLKDLITRIKTSNDVTIVSEKSISYQDAEAQSLIGKYNITKVPTVILSGETSKVSDLRRIWPQIGEEKEDGTLILTKMRPMYYDVKKGDFVGKLKLLKIVNSSCGELCTKASGIQNVLETATGIRFIEEQTREYNSTEGKAAIEKYGITKIPALIVSGDIEAYDELGLKQEWIKVGTVESDGSLVWRLVQPPYQQYPSGKIKGLATMVAIVDADCKECYDVNIHSEILSKMGVYFSNVTYYNSTSAQAKALIAKYKIEYVPTSLVNDEIQEYYSFTTIKQIWDQVGTVESDGWHVFRNMSALGSGVTYKIVATNETVKTT